MLKSYLTIAFRNLSRQKGYAFINIAGLAVGLACSMLIVLFVRDELSYDRFHEKADRIYRIVYGDDLATSGALAPALLRDVPEVEQAVRLSRVWFEVFIEREEDPFYDNRFFLTDSTFFDVFDFPLLQGDPHTALTRPFSVVVTEEMAQKLFGDEDPMGKTIRVQKGGYSTGPHDLTITGVARDVPHNAHFRFHFLASYSTLFVTSANPVEDWRSIGDHTYIVLEEGVTSEEFEEKLPAFIARHQEHLEQNPYSLQPLTSIHLHSNYEREIEANSDVRYLYIFSAVALVTLLIACVNYMNLSTARSTRRAKEVGIRKVAGAHRRQLVCQFLSESLLFTTIAVLVALGLVEMLAPAFNQLTGKSIRLASSGSEWMLLLAGAGLLVGVLAASYPALLLSSFQPVRVLKGVFSTGRGSAAFRNGLVVVQFAISTVLIAGTIIIQSQLQYVRTSRIGLNTEQVVVLETRGFSRQNYTSFKDELLQYTSIVGVTSSGQPLPFLTIGDFNLSLQPEGVDDGLPETYDRIDINSISVDPDFLQTLDIKLLAGQDFSADLRATDITPVLINEAAVQQWGWKEPIGKTFEGFRPAMVVVGVIEDFHYESMKDQIEPVILWQSTNPRFILVRVLPDDLPGTLDFIQEKWAAFGPGTPLDYTFLDARFDQLYKADERMARIFGIFAAVAIVIACLGLFGLAAYTAERRTKEIGIRKVLGASVANLVALLSKDFIRLVFIAFVVAVPVAYFAMSRWLEDFAYRIEIGPGIFLLAGGLALLIALATVSYQAVKAALADPVKSLRYE